MTRAGREKIRRGWRLWAVRLLVCAFVLQTVSLFAVSAPQRTASASAVEMAAMPDCPHHRAHGQNQEKPAEDGGCPVCQALGCALPGAPVIDLVAAPSERLIGLLAMAAPQAAPRVRLRHDSRPRDPPVSV